MSEKSTTPDSNKKLCCSVNPFVKGLCKDCYAAQVGEQMANSMQGLLDMLENVKIRSSQKD